MVKRLRRCPLTAESAVRFRMGLPKKYSTTLCGAVFFCMPLSGNDAATCLPSFVNLRKQILAVGSHRPHFCFPVGYIWETATSAWGCILLRCAETTRQLVAVVRICVSKFCRSSPFYGSRENPNGHANGNGNFRMGLRTSSVRETARQLVAVVRQFAQANSCRQCQDLKSAL